MKAPIDSLHNAMPLSFAHSWNAEIRSIRANCWHSGIFRKKPTPSQHFQPTKTEAAVDIFGIFFLALFQNSAEKTVIYRSLRELHGAFPC